MLPTISTLWPSVVIVSLSFNTFKAATSFWYFSAFSWYCSIVFSSGFTINWPFKASRINKSPCFTSLITDAIPTTAGISKLLAIIAEWDVLPPISVAKPLVNFLSNCAVSEGVKSWATTITSWSINDKSATSTPKMWYLIRVVTSLISAALSLMYSSSKLSNIEM